MIISTSRKFIFIKGRKVGGTSTEIILSASCGPQDIITPVTPRDEVSRLKNGRPAQNYGCDQKVLEKYLASLRRSAPSALATTRPPKGEYHNHMALGSAMRRLDRDCKDYRLVCCERSPYAKVLSLANSLVAFGEYRAGGRLQAEWAQLHTKLQQIFETGDFVKVRNYELYSAPASYRPLEVIRFEKLESDLRLFLRSLGVTEPVVFPHAKKGRQFRHHNALRYLTPRMIEKVNSAFDQEFRLFRYERFAPEEAQNPQ